MDKDKFLSDIKFLLKKGNFEEVDSIIDRFVPIDFTEKEITETLGLIRKKRKFHTLEKAATTFNNYDYSLPIVKRQLAQALIEQGFHDKAIGVLSIVDNKIGWSDQEKPEILGLIGRAQKQKFVETGDEQSLVDSIANYQEGWDKKHGDYRWHGINLVALQKRGVRDKISGIDDSESNNVARTILKEIDEIKIKNKDDLQVWDYATAMEASLALDNKEETIQWAKEYTLNSDLDAFQLGSTLRQLREIWQIKDNDIANALEPVFEYEILQREGGAITITPDEILDETGFQGVYGDEAYVPIKWLEHLFEKVRSIAKVTDKAGKPEGTGFLIKGSEMSDDWDDSLLFVTNSHVVSDNPDDKAPLHPSKAMATFTQLPGEPSFKLGKKLFYSPKQQLDAWICEIELTEEFSALDLSFYNPLKPDKDDPPQRIYVIGHPNGGDLVVSLYGNDLIGYELPYVHYKSPTDGGSSGSPVLSRDLDTFALHHKTRPALEVNEGVLFDHIREDLMK